MNVGNRLDSIEEHLHRLNDDDFWNDVDAEE
jgi:hypothetical protein